MDQYKHKFPQDAPVFGKPNLIVNPQKFDNNNRQYVNQALRSLNPDEIIILA